MVKNMIYFVVLLAVVLMSFGVSRQSIHHPDKEATWGLIRDVAYQPYFMLYGEVFADDIDPPCGEDPRQPACVTGHWITPIAMSMYLLIANILLINLLIAVFNNIFQEVNSVSHQVWMFQRFTVVMEYQQKPVLPPPFIAFSHCYSLLKYCLRKAKGLEVQRDNGLKLFLEKDDLERLYDFEEECVEGFFHEQEIILNQSTDERVKIIADRADLMAQKVEDINQKENLQTSVVQNLEFRLHKIEDTSERILSHLAVIHRFMSTQGLNLQDELNQSSGNLVGDFHRVRTISMSDNDSLANAANLQVSTRRRLNRSLTEVRSDAYIVEDGKHFEVVPVPEEPDELARSREALNDQMAAIRKGSVKSESDSDIYVPMSSQRPSTCDTVKRTPYLSVRQDTGASSESKDTLTPLGHDDDQTLVGGENSDETTHDINFEVSRHRALRQRTISLCRRNSETPSITGVTDINRSHISLNQLPMSRRQLSLTQSEPESDKDPAIGATAPVPASAMMGTYAVRHCCMATSKQHQQHFGHTKVVYPLRGLDFSHSSLDRPKAELSKAEMAALLEKQHLKECEENDYMILEDLFQARSSVDAGVKSNEYGTSVDYSHRHPLRRETAIELSPSKPPSTGGIAGNCGDSSDTSGPVSSNGGKKSKINTSRSIGIAEFQLRNERQWQRNGSTEQQHPQQSQQQTPFGYQQHPRSTSDYLNAPHEGIGRLFKKSSESLQKNSSTDTDYSAHPYRFIKQSSNDTTTSMTGSYNIDTPSLTAEPSLDNADTQSLTQTTVTAAPTESTGTSSSTSARYPPMRTSSMGAGDGRRIRDETFNCSLDYSTTAVMPKTLPALPARPVLLKKQFSVDYQGKLTATAGTMLKPPYSGSSSSSSKLGMNILKESSSSTEESKDGDSRDQSSSRGLGNATNKPAALQTFVVNSTAGAATGGALPTISTHLVQDEIAKLSSNIKSSTESEKDPPYNETMC